jgi:hypothetical protein
MEETKYCNDYINKKCNRDNCKFTHDENICSHFWNFNNCKFNEKCRYKHIVNSKPQKNKKKHVKNTETFKPINKNDVDMRLIIHDTYNKTHFDEQLTSKDVIIINNLFSDYAPLEIYTNLVNEIETCGIHEDSLLKPWHGDSHLIADDKLEWKNNCPTFNMIIERVKLYFNMDVKATRFNWYKDTSQWKPFHFDQSFYDDNHPQNFTVAISFGITREASFERDTKDKTKISIPISDGQCYAFCKKTNNLWRHGILQEPVIKQEGRISIICWSAISY